MKIFINESNFLKKTPDPFCPKGENDNNSIAPEPLGACKDCPHFSFMICHFIDEKNNSFRRNI